MRLYRSGLAGDDGGAAPRHAAFAPCPPHPAAFRRLVGGRAAGHSTLDRPQHLRLPAADLDGAHTRTAGHRRAPCRPDNFRGISPAALTRRALEVASAMHDLRAWVTMPMADRSYDRFQLSMASSQISLEAVSSISQIPADEWDACANPPGDPNPLGGLDTLASPDLSG